MQKCRTHAITVEWRQKKKLANNNNHSTDHLNSNVDDGNWEQKEQRLTKH